MLRVNGSTEKYSAVARSVERFVAEVRATSLSIPACREALPEIDDLIATIGTESPALNDALVGLRGLLFERCKLPARRTPDAIATRKLTKLLRLLGPLAAASAMSGFMLSAPAAAAIPVVAVGGTVFNPLTRTNETILQVVGSPGYAVRTTTGNIILLAQTVGDSFTDSNNKVQTVTAVTTTTYGVAPNAVTYVTGVTLKDASNVVTTTTVVTSIPAPPAAGGNGTGGGTALFPTGPGDIGQVSDIRYGAAGGSGNGGFEICVLGFCVGYPPTAGGNGAPGPTFTTTVPASHGTISIQSNNTPGIIVASIGGNGGNGGGSGGIGGTGAQGGAAGNGGDVTLFNYTNVITGNPDDPTKGINSHGIFVKSVAGTGGLGGTCYIGCSGGSGGAAAAGGTASAFNYGNITTYGDGAVGMLVQSLGGNAGSGGSSYGIVGVSGSGSIGGNGGTAYAENSGTIITNGDKAYGIQVQSVGGNGGSSGDSAGLAAFGGSGGGAGTGGSAKIKLNSTSSITTYGDYSHAAFVQSIGGGGGATGWSGGAVSFGSSGGTGNVGGTADVEAIAGSSIHTLGFGAYGIFAESVGGNGGTASGTGGIFTLGGSGGTGSNGGAVTVNSGATIVTEGMDARGVFAQSVGGGGGNANASGGLVSLGGSGSVGGTGGNVTVTLGSASNVTTYGFGADGVYAQSVGGGGGAGAASGGLVALGGSAGAGGTGGIVTVSNAGQIYTGGSYSRGIFAQSVGGGGGSGGDSGGLIAIGGSGNVASNGGAVTVSNSGYINTVGNMSSAMQAQSIGGGGGDGGTTGGVLLTIGGSGSGGGEGGDVIANLSGSLATDGDDSHGLLAQSIGGGGGNGGSSTSVSAFFGLALGGSGASGSVGGDVTANFTQINLLDPTITTSGDRSRGVFLQSVGGGGGNGGLAVQVSAGLFASASFAIGGTAGTGNTGGLVKSTGDVLILTTGDESQGFYAQSVGGGGGTGGAAVSVAVSAGEGFSAALSVGIGGAGGSGGDGGTVDVNSGGAISTFGALSTGFMSQSVGGGGGTGGFSVSVAGAVSDGVAIAGGLGIGGSGGVGGDGGTVTAHFDGDISTGGQLGLGYDSAGALIQSVGGGGGMGGFNVSAAISVGLGTAVGGSVGLGGTGGDGGLGGTVTGSVGGDVLTTGDRSAGVLIQSSGGGGGVGGFNVTGNLGFSGGVAVGASVGLGGSGGGGGDGGTVTGSALGTVQTFGDQSDGVLIQSVGGGGGTGAFNVTGNMNFGGGTGVSIGVGLGGSGGGAGTGGQVKGTISDTVVTHGDQSRGVVVQSVGGGGGAGAFNVTGGLAAGGGFGGTIGVGLGGTGGDGGGAGIVEATAESITTSGKDSAAFIAQSVGGGGGVGGFNVTGSLGFGGSGAGTIGIGLGGSGGLGGSASKVTATLTGVATTGDERSGAILAQSVGGGGGWGAFNVTGGIAGAGTGAGTLNIGLGGSGGAAGHAGAVDLTVVGHAFTDGLQSHGIVAQSVGGGGGSGDFNVSGGIAAAGTGSGQVGFGMGGRGGGGGNALDVKLDVNEGATISDVLRIASITRQDASAGIVAQSLGGGGGNGAFNITGGASFAGTGAGGVNVGIGGSGGDGGSSDLVETDISGYTSTLGHDSVGVIAQSVAGGGGNGSFNVSGGLSIAGTGSGTINVGVGGAGGDGADTSGVVKLRINDEIVAPSQLLVAAVTAGDRSAGVVAQSIGGGGGNGGFNVTGGINLAGTGTGGANIGVGGMGGDGGNAGEVIANITGGIGTLGEESDALVVQSIGGGGGNGGFNVSGTLSVSKNSGSLGVGVGGMGGDGGNAGAVTLDLNQRTNDSADTLLAVSTLDYESSGIIVQSLGGGGGNGGFNVTAGLSFASGAAGNLGIGVGGFGGGGGDADIATARVRGDIITGGDKAGGLLVQSLGGGGGNGGFNVTGGISGSKAGGGNIGLGIGGFGGDGGEGKAVNATIESDIWTSGDESYGATIQSMGGGGGNGDFNVTGGIAASFGETATGNFGVGIGGFGGGGGSGQQVIASLIGDVTTSGFKSHGILVQSAGGGGGSGGFNVTGNISVSKGANGSVGIGIGGFGGDSGNGGIVIADLVGNVTTNGVKSYGAVMQSVGGAGGSGGLNVTGSISIATTAGASIAASLGLGGFGGDGGHGMDVTGSVIGQYVTLQSESAGVVAQSVGGGGGDGGLNVSGAVALSPGKAGSGSIGIGGFGGGGGNAGIVKLTRIGDTSTSGANSDGVVVQSVGGGGGAGAINISGGIAAAKGTTAALGFGLGGFGGDGGNGAMVEAFIDGHVIATGLTSDRIVPQTESPGFFEAIIPALDDFDDFIDWIFEDYIEVYPEYRERSGGSNGVLVQSVGGGGGAGGLNVTGEVAITTAEGDKGRTAAIGIGGFGGGGGDAGNANLYLGVNGLVDVSAIGDLKNAVAVQSIGGGGGQGAINISAAISTEGQLAVGVGGFGGDGGVGKDVYANVNANLWAAGNNSTGFLAQSVGGGGGHGGINISAGILGSSKTKDPSIVFGLGGFGGVGNLAGSVTAIHRGQVIVEGANANGLLIQSVGGGGGNGGLNVASSISLAGGDGKFDGVALAVGIGGFGGLGADAGNVTLDSNGLILVNSVAEVVDGVTKFTGVKYASEANGILVQSIGGGGGAGGVNVAAAIAKDGVPIALAVGGTGGAGGNAGTVTVTRGYTIVDGVETKTGSLINTFGENSMGLVAQSIGGGGGHAGFNIGTTFNKSSSDVSKLAATIAIGGDGGDAGQGKEVIVRHNGDISTNGAGANGLLAQSITKGGGTASININQGVNIKSTAIGLKMGGTGGDGGIAGDVTVDHEGTIVTDGFKAAGIRAQSIGKGGGDASFDLGSPALARNSINISVGATGGAGGIAGDVRVTAAGFITTKSANSDGIAAQSIGGGGGASGALVFELDSASGRGEQTTTNSASIAIGLDGGEGGVAGRADVINMATINTALDSSRGILAQSIGGDGGTGGAATAVLVNAAHGLAVAVGGGGGSGAIADGVDVDNSGFIRTNGLESDGILAQSIGGGGGVGGMARSISVQGATAPSGTSQTTVSVAVGGGGGSAGTGSDVDVSNSGTIVTTGTLGYGIRAQSVGGGGGIGGAVLSSAVQGMNTNKALTVSIGGGGGDGNASGDVEVVNTGLIYTTGLNAAGISANAIGGGGGDAGVLMNLQGGFTGGKESNRVDIAVGGNGGSGGVGGNVSVTNRATGVLNSGTIITENNASYGILAQSIGGGGGNSSSIISINAFSANKNSQTLSVNFGAVGGDGNFGGTVGVVNAGLIQTAGEGSHGVLAQSVGGGGGNGGIVLAGSVVFEAPTKSTAFSLGGIGGDGGDGGTVTVTNDGTILTTGVRANGIVAQSIGGGGGNSSMGFSAVGDPKSLVLGNGISAIMGALGGGTGGTGGNVTVINNGDIVVMGEHSQGIVAQSINGGGGSLVLDLEGITTLPGIPVIGDTTPDGPADPLLVIDAGSEGTINMAAGKVTVTSNGTIGVGGKDAVAINLQAIGGGGGTIDLQGLVIQRPAEIDAGIGQQAVRAAVSLGARLGANNDGGDIEGVQTGTVVTTQDGSVGLEIQSIGGGGGRAIVDLSSDDSTLLDGAELNLGARGESGSNGGNIDRGQRGRIETQGDLASAAIVQSIGGGGGVAIARFAGSSGQIGGLTNSALGANGGIDNHGGTIVQAMSGGVVTRGDHSVGLVFQSIGAGGGVVALTGDVAPEIVLGGTGGATGSGGAITLSNLGEIYTAGGGAHGVLLQSIGGGGGAVLGAFANPTVTLAGANQGDGGSISFLQSGNVVVEGADTYGIVAQSLGGGGGLVGNMFAGTAGGVGASGAIAIDVNGSVVAAGAGSTAVFLQSLGSLARGNIDLRSTGNLRGGSGSGAAVQLDGGATNSVFSSGTLSAVSGLAVVGGAGNDTVTNTGLAVGNFALGAGANTLLNAQAATLVSIDTIDLRDGAGSTGVFTNAGNLLLGLAASRYPLDLLAGDTFAVPVSTDPLTDLLYGTRVISRVALDGDFVQTGTGHSVFDVAFGSYASDRFDVTGNATVDGTMDVTLTWLENSAPVTLFATAGMGVDLGLEVTDTLALDYRILASDIGIQLAFDSDFGLPFLTPNQQAIGGSLDSAVEQGNAAGIGRLLTLLGNLSAGQEEVYQSIFAELDPELLITPVVAQLESARDFGSKLFGCDVQRAKPEAICLSGGAESSRLVRDTSRGDFAFRESDTARLRVGIEVPMGNGWSVGAGAGYDDIGRFTFDSNRAEGSGEAVHGGLGVRKVLDADGRGAVSLQASAGSRSNRMARRQSIFVDGIGRSKYRSTYAGVSADVGYSFGSGALFARPALHLSMYNIGIERFTESGLEGLGVVGLKRHNWVGTANPEITLGTTFSGGAGRLSLTGGYVIHNKSRLTSPFRLIGASESADPAMVSTRFDKSAWKLGANVAVGASGPFSLDLGYDAEIGKSVEAQSVRGTIRLAF